MEAVQANTSITLNPKDTKDSEATISVPLDVIFRIFNYLQLPDIVAFISTCQECHALTNNDNRWKQLLYSHSPNLSPHLAPSSWYTFWVSQHRALNNLFQGKFTTTLPKQEGVSHMIPYGMRKGEEPTHLVLIKNGGKQIQSWDLKGEPTELFTLDAPLEPTEITWNSQGEPQLLFLNIEEFRWVCLNLATSTVVAQDQETSWNWKTLSANYCALAKGIRVGVWGKNGQMRESTLAIPIHNREGEIYFLCKKGWSNLVVCSQEFSEEKIVSQANHASRVSPHLLQFEQGLPSYLALFSDIVVGHRKIELSNTTTWESISMLLPHGCCLARPMEIRAHKTDRHYQLIATQFTYYVWIAQFDPKSGQLEPTQRIAIDGLSVREHKLITPSILGTSLVLIAAKFGRNDRGLEETVTGTSATWKIKKGQIEQQVWDSRLIADAAACTSDDGHLLVPQLSKGTVTIRDYTGNSESLQPFVVPILSKAKPAMLRASPWLSLVGFSVGTLGMTFLAFRTARRIWRVLPALSRS